MTEQELEVVKLKLRLEAVSVLTVNMYRLMAQSSSQLNFNIRNSLRQIEDDHANVVFASMKPEYSDMLAGEYEDALKGLIESILK